MSLLSYRNLTVSFGGPKLLDNAGLTIEKRERICLIGRNGEGKSTLLRIISGQITPDKGEVEAIPSIRIGKLDQEVPAELEGTVFEVVAEGLGKAAKIVAEYHHYLHELAEHPDDESIADKVDDLQHQLDQTDGWAIEHKVENILDRVELDGEQLFSSLSGGNKRRALLARALIAEPHILLLDEPTNHLDIPGIRWLEEFLRKTDVALLFVSHDRAFIRRVANRIVDLDRGQLTSWNCDYETYLQRKADLLAGEAKQAAVFDKKLAEEEVWIRKGIQARRTRNEGRVRALFKLREERAERRNVQGKTSLNVNESQLSGRKVITVDNISYAWGDNPIINNFETTIWRGDKIGIVGLNGSGKTTLLNLLLNKLEPKTGSVTHGTKLEVAYFDQHRAALDEKLSVAENVHPHSEMVTINGKQRHIITYLQDFLFTPQSARAPITKLSGGERARLLLARLFLQPANVLVLDEPTNDLDIETVELLEERLLEYQGTLLLVSHDRSFLDNVVTSTIALEGDGEINEYIGGCDEWLKKEETRKANVAAAKKAPAKAAAAPAEPAKPERKLTNKEREALKTLPKTIEKLEAEHTTLSKKMASSEYYQDPNSKLTEDAARLEQLEAETLTAYEQWEALTADS
ncbi:MAG: ATP-binding cassette domain-containing protein [Opitutales bacterium]|nr:ATP-binding cassette domain-containing protein [Opitutales bacterium]MDP4643776.1 ATP-binding cassette domain-containing protein [Opitutales bacterium]MDP4777178.1 ATP-binding cassette domain-containing protein [Opitutales bacterium]MDP4883918.1 ATP-binding cassette domain-containing protein [Opitutales bacterium]MDP5080332.1 ATP-binding cassette domain-containing protein [Opitutales bacterium]